MPLVNTAGLKNSFTATTFCNFITDGKDKCCNSVTISGSGLKHTEDAQ